MSVKHRMRVEKSEKNLFGNQGGNAVYSVPSIRDGVFISLGAKSLHANSYLRINNPVQKIYKENEDEREIRSNQSRSIGKD